MSGEANKPAILIVGGLGTNYPPIPPDLASKCGGINWGILTDSIQTNSIGFLGRFLALHIHENNLASEVRIVDKLLPQLAWLTPEFSAACSQDKFVQADASRERKSLLPIYIIIFL